MTDDNPYASFLAGYTEAAASKEPAKPETPPPGEYRNIWVWIEHVDGEVYPASLENLGKARELADQLGARCHAILFGHNVRKTAEAVGEYGADGAYVADHQGLAEFRLSTYRDLLARLVTEHRPEAFLFPATVMGRNLGAQLAAQLGTGIVPNCVQLEVDASERRLRHVQTSFEDRLLTDFIIPKERPQISTITPGSFRRPLREKGRTIRVVDLPMPTGLSPARVLIGKREPPLERRLETADVVVVGGLGLGSRESFRLTEELSSLVGGHVGATRGAVSCGWTDPKALITSANHRLTPRLYVACGVIGEYDHLKAIEHAKQIIAITPDAAAPITDLSDLIGVGDPTAILQAMIENLRAARKDRLMLG